MGRRTYPQHGRQPAQEPALPKAPQPPYDHDQTHIIDDRVERVCVQHLLAKSGAGHCNNGLKAKLGGGFSGTL
jgi:hypothetical protein